MEMVEQPNSIALRIAMVAADQADLVATLRWGYEWDLAAAALIAREAGRQSATPWAASSITTSPIPASLAWPFRRPPSMPI
jgi:fructose-1,6-bisphosphatase/inositol monophosphatase family enzyme